MRGCWRWRRLCTCGGAEYRELPVLHARFCCEPKTALKKIKSKKRRRHSGGGRAVEVSQEWPRVDNCWLWLEGTYRFIIQSSQFLYQNVRISAECLEECFGETYFSVIASVKKHSLINTKAFVSETIEIKIATKVKRITEFLL